MLITKDLGTESGTTEYGRTHGLGGNDETTTYDDDGKLLGIEFGVTNGTLYKTENDGVGALTIADEAISLGT